MDLSALTIPFSSVLVMGLNVVIAYAGIWAVKKVIHLVKNDGYSESWARADYARDSYYQREALYADGWTDKEYRRGYKNDFQDVNF